MKKNILQQVGVDGNGKPIMQAVNVEMTAEEIATFQNEAPKISYNEMVEQLIRERYSLSDELAILRQRDSKPNEFAEYNAYAEQCKAKAAQNVI